jgi:hypothetical protein
MTTRADPLLTPGVLVAGITAADLAVPGYSKRTRPSRWVSARMKVAAMRRYRLSLLHLRRYTGDHLIPIECGGHPTDPLNYWPQLKAEAVTKDGLENDLHHRILRGETSIEDAAAMMRREWAPVEG